ncbi:GTP-binding protein [Alteribacillus sp. YIM 98480]|uniref:CobW family GTP-binding protein n=1 Tax=Alteribacillus sp. YIM 98480 TaxID=2606599 RepID=UPI00131AF237|nr:GTP-binding protein [Alteribacillus sp. YIM 98480]
MSNKIPITIVTGCLGSGKTTVLNYLLQQIDNRRIAVIVNEFGQAGLDHHLLRKSQEKISLVNSGCMCCNSREDLEEELKELLFQHEQLEEGYKRIIIETTGLADPAPIIFTILHNPLLRNHFDVELILTTVDVENAQLQFENSPEFVKQISVSDHVILTKNDLVTAQQKEKVIQQVKSIHPSITIFEGNNGVVDVNVLQKLKVDEPFYKQRPPSSLNEAGVSSQVQSISFHFSDALDWTAFTLWLSLLLHTHGENVLRVKGILDVGEVAPVNLNGVQHIIHPPEHLDKWPVNVSQSFLVFIVRYIDPWDILRSLEAFQHYIGSDVQLMEYQESI